MHKTADLLVSIRCITKAFVGIQKKLCEKYGLTLLEMQVISFLYNNPDLNTAGDIVGYRMLSKGNVSQAVDSLIGKGLMERRPDAADRRRIHLHLLPKSEPITQDADREWKQFNETLFQGFSEKEKNLYDCFREKLMQNAKEIMKGEEENERD